MCYDECYQLISIGFHEFILGDITMKKFFLFTFLSLCSCSVLASELNITLRKMEKQIDGNIGVAVLDSQTNTSWNYNENKRFNMMSVFKPLACANVLYDVQNNQLTLNQKVEIKKTDLISWAPITENFVGGKMSLRSVCGAAMLMSDNYAANLVLKQIEGPRGLTAFLRTIGDNKTSINNFEPRVNFSETGTENNTTTPLALNNTMKKLLIGNVLNTENKTILKMWMVNDMFADSLARSVLPRGWNIADKSGAWTRSGSRSLTAMVWKENRKPLFISVFVNNSKYKTLPELNRVIADVSEQIFEKFDIK